MIIYWDLMSYDKMLSNIYKIQEIADRLCLEVEGKMVGRTEGNIDDSLIGGNVSTEGPEGKGTVSTVFTEAYKKYTKDYVKSIKGKFEEQRPERVKPFRTGTAEQIKHMFCNFKNYQFLLGTFFIGENMNPDGMVILLDYHEDEMEKCPQIWQLLWICRLSS
ncbi:hypothetical protein H1C71_030154 [Ictidomys tridecemlineatus]|uniref:Translationally-controlled tumor protein n=1 Tax=Ictidomys tridecemlineatus TaxID=43179 RepID=A0A287CS70_ICTTR|nr:hypothetical protein H1C71_030154 [Ictidomys tridecemlineatus]